MKTLVSIVILLFTLTPVSSQPAEPSATTTANPYQPTGQPGLASPTNPFSAGLLSEEGENDLAAAATAYRQAIQDFDRQREGAANAIFRLGEVYRKMGRLEEAKVQYARILREFPDKAHLTELSHTLLLGEEPKPAGGIGGGGFGGGSGGGGSGGGGMGSAASPGTGETPAPTDPGYYEKLMLQRYGIIPGRAGRAPESAREKTDRIACVNNLKQLGLAARIYATDNQGAFPPNVEVISNEIAVIKVLVCPSDTERSPADSWTDFDPAVHMSYEYQGASATEDEPGRVLFKCPIHGHVALGDGSVQQGHSDAQTGTPQADEIMRRRYGLGGMNEAMRQRYGLGAAAPQPAQAVDDILNTIQNNLLKIDGAKQQWALENRQTQAARPSEHDIGPYLLGGFPKPLVGERYEINTVGEAPVAVFTQPVGGVFGMHEAGDRITMKSTGGTDRLTFTMIEIAGDGTLQVAGEPYDLDQLIAKLKGQPAGLRSGATITIRADEDADVRRIIEVLDACKAAGVSRVSLAADATPAINQELDRLTEETEGIQRELVANGQERGRIQSELAALVAELQEARSEERIARQRLHALDVPAEHLPRIVNQDERYQRLKAEYESSLLDGNTDQEKRALARLNDWVAKIYEPELKAEYELAQSQLDGTRAHQKGLGAQHEALQAEYEEKRSKRTALMDQYNQLKLLTQAREGQRAANP